MRLDLRTVLKDYRGKDMKTIDEDKNEEPLTIKLAINSIINGIEVTPDGRAKPLTAEEKGKIYQLSTKIWGDNEIKLTVDDISFIKKRMDSVSNITPLIYGRLLDVFEGEKVDKKEKV